MKISVPRQHPLSLPHGEQPSKYVCRQYSSVTCSVLEPLECPREKHRLWWSRLGPGSSTDCFPPDDDIMPSFISNDAFLTKEKLSSIQPPLNLKNMASENDQQLHRLAQVTTTSFQGHRQDHTEVVQDYTTVGEADMAGDTYVDRRHSTSSSDDEYWPRSSVLVSECRCEHQSADGASEGVSMPFVKLMCSFGGKIMVRPVDGKLRYVGGETRIVSVCKGVSFTQFMSKMSQVYGSSLGLKYQLPDEELDALISVSSDDDLQNMMEENDKVRRSGVAGARLRLFFFTASPDVGIAESKTEGNNSVPWPDQGYVDAINGLPANSQTNLPEADTAVPYPFVTVDSNEGCGRSSHLEHGNEVSQVSAPSSSLSSPIASGQAIFKKPPGLQDLSSQTVNRDLSKPTSVPFGFEEETGQDVSDNSSSMPFHYHCDPSYFSLKFSQSMDSPRISVPDGLNLSNGENGLGLRLFDSQSKITHFPDFHSEFRSSLGLPLEHWHEATYMRDITSPQGDYQHVSQQYTGSLPSLQQSYRSHPHAQYQNEHQYHQFHQHQPQPHYQPQQQQKQQHQHQHQHGRQQHPSHQHLHSWYPHNERDPGLREYSHQDVPSQPHHHQLPYHHLVHNAPVHDGCSLNSEHHGTSRSTQLSTQTLLGLAPVLPYRMGLTPSPPRIGVHDCQGKCPCGLQHSQVHRGITVSIGEQPYTRRPPFQGDQAVRKQALRSSSRLYDDDKYGADAASWQQANHSMLIGEVEHKEFTNHWPFSHERHSRDPQFADSLARTRNVHYAEPLNYKGGILPSHDRPETSIRCLCANCEDYRRPQMEATKGHSTNMEVSDHASDWSLHWKGFDPDGGTVVSGQKIFPRASVLKDGEQKTVDERILEVESGFCVSQLTADNSRKPVVAYIDHSRKVQRSSGAVFGAFGVSDEPMLPLPALAADWPSKLTKKHSELTILRSNTTSEQRLHHDVLSGQQGQQMQSGKDFQAMVVVGGLPGTAGSEKFENNIAFSEANKLPAMSISLCKDLVYSGAGRAASDAGQHCSLNGGPSSGDEGGSSVSLAGRGDLQQSNPDVIPLSSVVEIGTFGEMLTSLTSNHSPLSSVDIMKFSFAADKPMVSRPEGSFDKESFALGMSAHGELADSMTSSVLDYCSNETLIWKVSDAEAEEEENVTKAKGDTKRVSRESNVLKLQLGEDYGVGLAIIKDKSLEDGMEAVTDKTGATKDLLEANGVGNSRALPVGVSDGSNKPCNQEEASPTERNEHSIFEAEAEAIARGLQIIMNSDLEDMKELGSGTYGTVYHGKWRGSDVAIKRIKASCFTGPPSDQERLIADFWREACTLGQLHHPNVVAFYGVVPDGPGGTLATVTEYMVNGSLKQVLSKKDRTIDRRKRLFIAMDAAFGMEYLHSKNIVHFDLKCENLLVNMRDAHRPICKVGDFGLSKVKHHTLVSCGVRGTLPWMAPELLTGNCGMVSDKVDVFSFGIVMWELLTGEEPYANMHCGVIIGGIANNTLRPSIPSWCDPAWRSLMERCWSGNPVERPAFAEVAKELRAIAATMNLK